MQNPASEQVVKTLKDSNCVLVAVKNSPSVDELTAAIGLTLILNRMNKHAVTVFSGHVPSTLEFLQPESAIDTTTDSLRDFIIALDKSKADKLRYKVEDNVVRIFITPYKSSISEKDLEFSQGEFNVDVVVALGVVAKEDFDQAVTTHGRILHDATVVTLTARDVVSEIGAINWQEPQASGVSEMVASISEQLGENVLDGQIATALMTGMVAETDRFKNALTTPQVLSLSAKLMAAGANQQLIAEKLEEPEVPEVVMEEPQVDEDSENTGADGTLEISHEDDEVQNIEIDDDGNLQLPEEQDMGYAEPAQDQPAEPSYQEPPSSERTYMEPAHPPIMFGQDDSGLATAQPLFTAADGPPEENLVDAQVEDTGFMASRRERVVEPLPNEDSANPVNYTQPPTQTLTELEAAVDSPHLAVMQPQEPSVPASTESSSVDDFLGSTQTPQPLVLSENSQPEGASPVQQPEQQYSQPSPTIIQPEEESAEEGNKIEESEQTNPPQTNQAPPVPPPLMPQAPTQPQFFDADGNNQNPFLNPSN